MENKYDSAWCPTIFRSIPTESIVYSLKKCEIFAGWTMESLFLWIGFFVFCYFCWKFFVFVISTAKNILYSSPPDYSQYGQWSVITGASDGIGKAIAHELASYGQNVILMARNKEKLQKVSTEIEAIYSVKTKYFQVDFSQDESIYKEIKEFLDDFEIGVLVNNVGIGTIPGDMFDIPDLESTLLRITRVNMFCLYKLHQIVLPGMVKRGRGRIFNISSGTALRPDFRFPVYGATKIFGDYFSRAMHSDYLSKGILIQSVVPFAVATKMIGNPSSNLFCRTAEDLAQSLIASNSTEAQVYGCWQYALLGFLSLHTPTWLFSIVTKGLEKKMKNDMLPQKKST